MSIPYVDKKVCIGCGTCEAICPQVFKVNDEALADVIEADFEAHKEAIDEAIEACPVDCISWKEGAKPDLPAEA
ncbi:MAG: ferredoxin [Candidatus Marinimicrobia bacterium]|nr:ferredoxin [Candidatus Neomarinimicrobiota bacterium]